MFGVFLRHRDKICLAFIGSEGRLIKGQETLDFSGKILFLDLFHALLIKFFDLKDSTLLLLLCVLSGLLGLNIRFLFLEDRGVILLLEDRLVLDIEHFTEGYVLWMILQRLLGLLNLGRNPAKDVVCLVHAALGSLLLVLMIPEVSLLNGCAPALLLNLVLMILEAKTLGHSILVGTLRILLLLVDALLLMELLFDEVVLVDLAA